MFRLLNYKIFGFLGKIVRGLYFVIMFRNPNLQDDWRLECFFFLFGDQCSAKTEPLAGISNDAELMVKYIESKCPLS